MASQPDPGVVILPRSLLDTDFYKARTSDTGDVSCLEGIVINLYQQLTMQQAVLHHFPEAQTTYKFSHRDANIYFTRQCYEQFVASIPCARMFPLLLLFLYVDILEVRVLNFIFDTRGTHLVTKHMPVFQAFVP